MSRILRNILSGMGSVLELSPSSRYEHYQGDSSPFIHNDLEPLSEDVRLMGQDFYNAAENGRQHVERQKEQH